MKTNNNNIPKDIIELLPWYAIGCLSDEEHANFQTALLKYPELQRKLDEERNIIDLVSQHHELLDESALQPSAKRLENVLSQLEDNSDKIVKTNTTDITKSSPSLFERFKDFTSSLLPDNFGTLHYASVAVAIFSAAIFFSLVEPIFNQDNHFVPASAKTESTTNNSTSTVLIVGLNGDPSSLQNLDLISGKYSTIEPVEGKKGMYHLSLNQKLDTDKVQKLISDLQAETKIIWFAGEAF